MRYHCQGTCVKKRLREGYCKSSTGQHYTKISVNFVKRGTCQKASRYKGKQAPPIPLPINDVPFKRIVMDIVGPLPCSQSGNRYIPVVCNYATIDTEAVAIKSIEAGRIAEKLIK